MNSPRFRGLAAVIAMVSVTTVAACSSSTGSDGSSTGGADKVTIKVEGWRPGDKQPTIDAVKAQAAAFNQANPGIVVEPVEWEWKAETFAAQLAGNQLPTTFRVPFTDTKGLAERKQLGTVGLWCGLHGEAFLQAGMHHLECQFDWHLLKAQLQAEAALSVARELVLDAVAEQLAIEVTDEEIETALREQGESDETIAEVMSSQLLCLIG